MTSGVVERESGGQTFRADWFVKDGMVHVISNIGKRSTQVGGSPPEVLAGMILRDFIQDRKVEIAKGP